MSERLVSNAVAISVAVAVSCMFFAAALTKYFGAQRPLEVQLYEGCLSQTADANFNARQNEKCRDWVDKIRKEQLGSRNGQQGQRAAPAE